MSRSIPEWIGKTPDTPIPPRVRLRVFEHHSGVCHISGRRIRPGELWDCDHVIALINGGEHRENNLAPALRDKHREKTVKDVAEKSRISRKRSKSLSIRGRRRIIPGRRFNGDPIPARKDRMPIIDHTVNAEPTLDDPLRIMGPE